MADQTNLLVPGSSTVKPSKSFPLDMEIGRTGLNRWAGYVQEEFLPELRGPRGMRTYREMADNDDIVGAILYAIEFLARQTTWKFEPAPDAGPDGERMAEWFTQALMEDMSVSWSDTLSEIMQMLPYGFALMEVIYKRRDGATDRAESDSRFIDGQIGWRKWSLRSPESIQRWEFDEAGGIQGAWQSAPPVVSEVYIPIERCLLFRTTSRKNNPEGRSVLRNSYRSWYFKRRIQEIEGIGIERDLAGFPVMRPPEDLDLWNVNDPTMVALKAEAEKIVKNIRRDAQEGLVLPHGWEFELLASGSRRQFDTSAIITRYDERIAMSVMADFILLGHDAVGSRALAASKVRVFGLAMNAFLDHIADIVNRFAIPRLAELNGWDTENVPSLTHTDVEPVDLTALGDYITKLSGAGVPLFPNPPLERHLLTVANIPVPEAGEEFSPEQRAEQQAEEKAAMQEQMAQGLVDKDGVAIQREPVEPAGGEGETGEDIEKMAPNQPRHPAGSSKGGQFAAGLSAGTTLSGPIRYDPSTDRYTGHNITLGQRITHGGRDYTVARRSGFTIEVDDVSGKPAGSISVDPYSPEYKGDARAVLGRSWHIGANGRVVDGPKRELSYEERLRRHEAKRERARESAKEAQTGDSAFPGGGTDTHRFESNKKMARAHKEAADWLKAHPRAKRAESMVTIDTKGDPLEFVDGKEGSVAFGAKTMAAFKSGTSVSTVHNHPRQDGRTLSGLSGADLNALKFDGHLSVTAVDVGGPDHGATYTASRGPKYSTAKMVKARNEYKRIVARVVMEAPVAISGRPGGRGLSTEAISEMSSHVFAVAASKAGQIRYSAKLSKRQAGILSTYAKEMGVLWTAAQTSMKG